jgi:hypothetical protein
MALKRWMYHGGRPNTLTRIINRGCAIIHSSGIAPNWLVTLEVVGRQSGKSIRFPLVMLVIDGDRYLVSMLGEDANWVKNVRAAGGKARLIHGIKENVILEEEDFNLRAPIIKMHLHYAPGARPHIPVDKDAPLSDFEEIASKFPVFKLVSQPPKTETQ